MASRRVIWYFLELADTGLKISPTTAVILAAQAVNPKLFQTTQKIYSQDPPNGMGWGELSDIGNDSGLAFIHNYENQTVENAILWECGNWLVTVYDGAFIERFHYITVPDKKTAERVAKKIGKTFIHSYRPFQKTFSHSFIQ